MDPGLKSPLVDLFLRGEASREVKLLAAQGALAPRAHEQIALLALLTDDPDTAIAERANATLAALPVEVLRTFLAGADVPDPLRRFFAARGVGARDDAAPDRPHDTVPTTEPEEGTLPSEADRPLASLPIADRLKLATKGSREQRAQLIRDPNKLVAAAVLSSPKLTDAEVESFVKMGNVSEEVLRVIGANRTWLKNYGVILGLTRNPKTPPAISMQMMHRLTEKDVKMLGVDRNVPESLRLAARRALSKAKGG